MRICAIGDSFVNGTGDPDCLGWVGRLALREKQLHPDLTLYNLGVRRETSGDIRRRWAGEAAARLPGGVDGRLIFSFGVNDCSPNEDSGQPRVSAGDALENAEAILSGASSVAPTLMAGPPPVADGEVNARIAALDTGLSEISEAAGVPYLSVFEELLNSGIWMSEAEKGDGAHPGAGGYEALAGLIGEWRAWRGWFE